MYDVSAGIPQLYQLHHGSIFQHTLCQQQLVEQNRKREQMKAMVTETIR